MLSDSNETNNVFKTAIRNDSVIKVLGSILPFIRRTSSSPNWARATAGLAILTITTCYFVALSHLPPGINIPQISYTGFLYPERYIYLTGFLLTFLCALITTRQLHVIYTHVLQHTVLSRLSLGVLTIAIIGMLLQAIVPFQQDLFEVLLHGIGEENAQTLTHDASALVFFLGTLIHGVLMVSDRIFCRKTSPIRMPYIVKGLMLILAALAIVSRGYSYGGRLSKRDSYGLGQRCGVLFILTIFSDYARDVKKALGEISLPR